MNRYVSITFSAIFLLMAFLPCQVLAASITQKRAAIGYDCTASGEGSTAMGTMTTASGYSSTAMGIATTASGNHSTAMGTDTTASGNYSTAMGKSTIASGNGSTAMGHSTIAGGNNSLAGGMNMQLTDTAYHTFVWGCPWIPESISTGFAFLIFPAGVAGKVGIGTTSPSYKLHVNGTAYATGAAGALSDRRHKENINDLSLDALRVVKELRPVTFAWKEPQDNGMKGTQLGFIAQEVEEVLPETVLTQDNDEQTKGLKYNALIPLLTKAIQQLEAENEELKARSEALMSLVCQDHSEAAVCQ